MTTMISRLAFACAFLALGATIAFIQLREAAPVAPTGVEFTNSAPGADFRKLLARAVQSDDFDLNTGLEITQEGLARTRDGAVNFFGHIHNSDILSIEVNGSPATVDPATKTWSYKIEPGSGQLHKGINRIFVRAFTSTGSSGDLLGQRSIDIHFDAGISTEISGVIEADEVADLWEIARGVINDRPWHVTRWTVAESPYHVTADIIVPEEIQLVIEPGVTVFFDKDTQLIVHGELHAAGTDFDRIHMRSTPGVPFVSDIRPELKPGPPHWGGIKFRDSDSARNLVSKTDIEYAQSTDGSVGAERSRLRIDDVSIAGTHEFMIYTVASSLIVENCIFGNIFAEDEAPIDMTPPIDNTAEHIKGEAGVTFPTGGYYIIRNNYFGTNKGHNDNIDVDSNQHPDAVVQILNNYFAGNDDEAIDAGGDLLIDGNVFRDFRKGHNNDGDGESNVVSTGDTLGTVLVLTRNIFIDVDHVINLKRESFGYFENNTVFGISGPRWSLENDPPHRMLDFSAISLLIPDIDDPLHAPPRDPAGLGAYTSGNVFVDVPQAVFGYPDLNPETPPTNLKSRLKSWLKPRRTVSLLEMHDSLLESIDVVKNADLVHGRKFDFEIGTAQFVNPGQLDFTLLKNSPGYRHGPNGIDMGAVVPQGASISGEPKGITTSNHATLVIGGPGIFSFVYRLNDGPWSDEIEIGDPRDYDSSSLRRTATLELKDLPDGRHTIYVRGRNFASELQPEATSTVSNSWVVKSN